MIQLVDYGEALFSALLADAQGHDGGFMAHLRDNWLSGERRFDLPGEMLLGVLEEDRLIAVGGISHDPYTDEPNLGRVRHFYVVTTQRRRGVGAGLVQALVQQGRQHFDRLRLLTNNPAAAAMYERCGFVPSVGDKESHRLVF